MDFFPKTLVTIILAIPIILGPILGPFLFFGMVEAYYIPTSVLIIVCGDGIKDMGEFCDDGADNGKYGSSAANRYCNTTCDGWAPYCGDGIVQANYGEECDDRNNVSGDGCSADCKREIAVVVPGAPGVYIPPPVPTQVILKGIAYPEALITALYDGKVITIAKADSQANFKIEITDITAGVYTFSLWAEDRKGRRSITFSFTNTVSKGTITTVSGIFIPPTIELGKVKVLKGETLDILGQTAPLSELSISVESPQITGTTTADKVGDWDYPLDTTPLDEGSHTTRAKAETPDGLLSSYSKVLGFYIGPYAKEEICPRADFNKDGKTNLVDFSIMLYWWGKYNPCVDMNQDGIVNLPDFSILMYWWTG